MRPRFQIKRWGIVLLAAWCLLFLHGENTQKSMVRAVLLEQQGTQWQVGLLYQAPEAAADAADASAALRFALGQGETLERAVSAAETLLPETANYRLCDYLLTPEDVQDSALSAYETLVLERQCGRTAARWMAMQFALDKFAEACREQEELPEKLLDKLKACSDRMPRLYAHDGPVLLPVLKEPASLAERCLLRVSGKRIFLPQEDAELYCLLQGMGTAQSFWLDGKQVKIRRSTVSVTLGTAAVSLRLDCQRAYGTPAPGTAQRQELERRCAALVTELWTQGIDVLHLQQCYALQDETSREMTPTKNACPQVQADVRFLPF